jgi:hypothetical protein
MLISKAQPNLIGGVSQQPDGLRLDSQCRLQENAYGVLTEGLKKRAPTKWIGALSQNPADNYQISNYHWINRDATERYIVAACPDNGNTTVRLRAWDLDGNDIPVIDTGGDPDLALPASLTLQYIEPYVASVSSFRWTTVNDYTFLVIPDLVPELDAGNPAPAQDPREAFVYIRQGNYKTQYMITLKTVAFGNQTVYINTWDGTTSSRSKTKFTITFSGVSHTSSQVWTFSAFGYSRTFTTDASPSNSEVAQGLAAAINAAGSDQLEKMVTATYTSGDSFTLETNTLGAPITNITISKNVGSGSATATDISPQELESIKTEVIAADLAAKINELGGIAWSATQSGSVLRITNPTNDIVSVTTSDSVGDTATKGYFLTVDNFDELPPRCKDGVILRVQGSVESAEDDFYVKFVANSSGAFGLGEWRETVEPERLRTLKQMPLVLIRKQDDSFGSATTVPFQIYFSLEEFPWSECLVGDSQSNPVPSFVGQSIKDICFHSNRLALITKSTVALSETGVYGNFWRTTVRQLLDSDPIDLTVSGSTVAYLDRAFPLNERLMLFSDRAQFVLSGEPLLTPKTASIQFVTSYRVDTGVAPITVGRSAYFVANREQWANLYEFQQIADPADIAAGSYQATSVTTQVPKYIPSGVTVVTASPAESVFIVRTGDEPTSLFVWKYFIDGERVLQSAWSKWTFQREVISCQFYDNQLYLLTSDAGTFELEYIDLKFGTETFADYIEPLLDRQFSLNPLTKTYNAGLNTTTITVPTDYFLKPGVFPIVTYADGTVKSATVVNTTQFTVTGDVSATNGMTFGYRYTFKYRFGEINLKEEASQGGRNPVVSGRYQNLFGVLRYTNTNTFVVSTQILSETAKTMIFTASKGNNESGDVKLDQGEFRFPIFSKSDEVVVEVTNNVASPVTLIGAEWIANFTTNFPRIR